MAKTQIIGILAALGGLTMAAATTARGQEGAPAVPLGSSAEPVWQAAEIALPSGAAPTLYQVIQEVQPDGAQWLRLRYVLPDLTRADYPQIEADFAVLCQAHALAYAAENAPDTHSAVISIGAAETEFGVATPDVAQFFEAFRLENATCIWEAF